MNSVLLSPENRSFGVCSKVVSLWPLNPFGLVFRCQVGSCTESIEVSFTSNSSSEGNETDEVELVQISSFSKLNNSAKSTNQVISLASTYC